MEADDAKQPQKAESVIQNETAEQSRGALATKTEVDKFIFVGDGRRKEVLEQFVRENDLYGTVFFLGRQVFVWKNVNFF